MSSIFINKKPILKKITLKIDFAIKLSDSTSVKRFMCLKWFLKNLSTILHTQFNYRSLPLRSCFSAFSSYSLFSISEWNLRCPAYSSLNVPLIWSHIISDTSPPLSLIMQILILIDWSFFSVFLWFPSQLFFICLNSIFLVA